MVTDAGSLASENRSHARSAVRALLLAALGAALLLALMGAAASRAEAAKPNILLLITDDQPVADNLEDTMSVMPNTRQFFGQGGTKFTNAFDTQPLCCPSRASMFSGRYSHNHGITINDGRGFNADKTFLHRLRQKGYYLALVGKYLNHIPLVLAQHDCNPQICEKPGPFDYVAPALTSAECNNQPVAACPNEPWLLEDRAETAIQQAKNSGKPWVLVYATESPHYPWTVTPNPPLSVPTFGNPPSFCETEDLTGYPSYCAGNRDGLADKAKIVRERAKEWNTQIAPGPFRDTVSEREQGMIPELQATDQALGTFYTYLAQQNQSANTLGFFISDNGWLWGQHSIWAKSWPYMESINVPFFARWPGHIPAGQVNNDVVANIDIAPTIFDATGIPPKYTVDGQPLPVQPFGSQTRRWILTENPTAARNPNGSVDIPVWSSYVTKSRQYIEWKTGKHRRFVEDYDLRSDPWELHASNARNRKIAHRLARARDCVGTRQCP